MSEKANKNDESTQAGDKPRLTLKQRKFCFAFVGEADGNGREAARLAGYKGNNATLSAVAYENLRKPQITLFIEELRADVEKKIKGRILSAADVLVGLTQFANADVADLFPEDEWLQAAKRQGVSKLIKTIQRDKDTGNITKIEMYNAHGAHVDLGKYHKLFTDRIEIVKPTEAARETIQRIMSETGMSEEAARAIVAPTFGISEQELVIDTDRVM